MVTPDTAGVLLLVFAARAVSPRAILLCIPAVAITAALVTLFTASLKQNRFPLSSGAAALLSIGIGGVLCAALGLLFSDAPAVTEPTLAALLIAVGCEAANERTLPFMTYPAALIIGLFRELLTGRLWGVPLFSGVGAFADVTGGMLVVAVVLFLFGLSQPVLHAVPFTKGLQSAVLPVAVGLLFRFVPLPPLYALWATLATAAVAEVLLSEAAETDGWYAIVPFLLLSDNVLPFLAVFAVTVLAAAPLVRRLTLFPPLRRFGGAPCTAVITAMVRGIVSAVF